MRTNRIPAILRVLEQHGPCSPRQITDHMGIPYKCLYGATNYLRRMVDDDLIHVFTWDRQEGHGGPPIPIYALGPGRNERRPKSLRQLKMPNKYPPTAPSALGFLLGVSPCR